MKMGKLDKTAMMLVLVGGVNWGLIGTLGFDLIAVLFGDASTLTRVAYSLIGLSAVYMIYYLCTSCGCTKVRTGHD